LKFKHRPWGEHIAKFVLSADGPKRKNIFAAPGMGKTGIFYDIFDTLRVFGEAKRALVLAPRRVAQNSWPDEQKKWSESFGHLSVAVAIGSPAQRLAALRQNADITCINYDNIQWLLETYGDQFPFDTVAADESSKLRGLRISLQKHHKTGKEFINGQGGKRSKALASVAHTKVRNWLNMTGSPAPNGLQDLWGQTWFIDGGVRLGRSFTSFSDRWFRPVPGSDGYSQIEPFPHAQKEIEALIKDISITVDEAGMRVLTTDGVKQMLLSLKLDGSKFEKFHSNGTHRLGVNVAALFKLLHMHLLYKRVRLLSMRSSNVWQVKCQWQRQRRGGRWWS
jgi:hypothetical protein